MINYYDGSHWSYDYCLRQFCKSALRGTYPSAFMAAMTDHRKYANIIIDKLKEINPGIDLEYVIPGARISIKNTISECNSCGHKKFKERSIYFISHEKSRNGYYKFTQGINYQAVWVIDSDRLQDLAFVKDCWLMNRTEKLFISKA